MNTDFEQFQADEQQAGQHSPPSCPSLMAPVFIFRDTARAAWFHIAPNQRQSVLKSLLATLSDYSTNRSLLILPSRRMHDARLQLPVNGASAGTGTLCATAGGGRAMTTQVSVVGCLVAKQQRTCRGAPLIGWLQRPRLLTPCNASQPTRPRTTLSPNNPCRSPYSQFCVDRRFASFYDCATPRCTCATGQQSPTFVVVSRACASTFLWSGRLVDGTVWGRVGCSAAAHGCHHRRRLLIGNCAGFGNWRLAENDSFSEAVHEAEIMEKCLVAGKSAPQVACLWGWAPHTTTTPSRVSIDHTPTHQTMITAEALATTPSDAYPPDAQKRRFAAAEVRTAPCPYTRRTHAAASAARNAREQVSGLPPATAPFFLATGWPGSRAC